MPRRKLVAGNWKMNTTRAEAVALAQGVAAGVGVDPKCDVAVIPPFPWLDPVAAALKGETFDRAALGRKGQPYERLDQLLVELLLGAR